jgi:predicted MFS family arabinose efflux permease
MNTAPPPEPAASMPSAVWGYVLAGLSASLVGIGLARFAYTPLIPALIRAHWFAASAVVYLSAANLAGYLIGAAGARWLAQRTSSVLVLRVMMLSVSVSLLACAFPLSMSWFFGWRLISGIGGGAIMVVVAGTVLPNIPEHRRGAAAGCVFLGVGLGIALSGTIVPLLLQYSLRTTWLGIGGIGAALTAATWLAWPTGSPIAAESAASVVATPPAPSTAQSPRIWPVYAEYALMATGLVPPMVFLVDFVARGLGAGDGRGALMWICYGAGSIAGPPVYGWMADRAGARVALRWLVGLQAPVTLGLGLTLTDNVVWLCVLSALCGSFPPGIVPMVLTWIRELFPDDDRRQSIIWSRATICFAAFQALAAYAFSAMFDASGGSYRLVFVVGAAALAATVLLDLFEAPARPSMR